MCEVQRTESVHSGDIQGDRMAATFLDSQDPGDKLGLATVSSLMQKKEFDAAKGI